MSQQLFGEQNDNTESPVREYRKRKVLFRCGAYNSETLTDVWTIGTVECVRYLDIVEIKLATAQDLAAICGDRLYVSCSMCEEPSTANRLRRRWTLVDPVK